MSITEVRPDKVALAKRRRTFGRIVRHTLQAHGDDFAGFAIVTWNHRGDASSGYYAATGPIAEALVPSYVSDAINRHITIEMAQTLAVKPIDGDA